jgi:alpha-L-fucosidase 2
VTGLRARGGVTIDLCWQDGRLTAATLTADRSGSYRVRLPDGALRTMQLHAATKTELPVV